MLNNITRKGKHLTIYDRTYIEDALSVGYSLSKISKSLEKDPTTISKEVKRNRTFRSCKSQLTGGCVSRKNCEKKHLCDDNCDRLCKKCRTINCYRSCPDYKDKVCNKILRFPMYVMVVMQS